jgi:hypothetical protein
MMRITTIDFFMVKVLVKWFTGIIQHFAGAYFIRKINDFA